MKIKIKFGKRSLAIIGILLIISTAIIVYSYGTNNPSILGHSQGEVNVVIGGVTKTLQQAITDGNLGGLSCRIATGTPAAPNSTATCNSNEILMSGGSGSCPTSGVEYSVPNSASPTGWVVKCRKSGELATSYAMCCN